MKRWGLCDNDKCRRCGYATEDIDHMFTCPSVKAQDDRRIAGKTSPFTMMVIIDTLKHAS